MTEPILKVAVPSPLYQPLDYLPPRGSDAAALRPGQRLRVPLGRREVVGVLVGVAGESAVGGGRLRRAVELLDAEPLLPADILDMLRWAAAYYCHPPGEVHAAALPVLLRRGRPARPRVAGLWRLTPEGAALDPAAIGRRAPRQAALLAALGAAPAGLAAEALAGDGPSPLPVLRAMAAKGWVEQVAVPPAPSEAGGDWPEPSPEQREAIDAIHAALGGYQAFLLEGVTGSGKTEVYLQAIEAVLAQGRQALVLVPEIGLTPQLVRRFRRLGAPVALLHSGLSEGERLNAWLAARSGEARLVLGTRSAVFVPLAEPGVFVIDEEHDASYKQQDGFRYSARDLLVWRARRLGVPVVLGSATPSLESLHNARRGRYHRLHLPRRAGGARPPRMRLLDVRGQPMDEGLSAGLVEAMHRHLGAGGQVLLFLNRRGFAPAFLCHDCGWLAECPRCDMPLTFHRVAGHLQCHHCDSRQAVPVQCPACGSPDLRAVGAGTERVEAVLRERFAGVQLLRIDRDTMRARGALEAGLARARSGEAKILLGTQMLAKGHHFPGVSLVGILDADQGLFSADFRAPERMAQTIVQVAGRAGRAERPGEVLIQTHHPEHPLLQQLVRGGYPAFAEAALAEREAARLPPFGQLALLRAEAPRRADARAFLDAARASAEALAAEGVQLWGPVPSPMERRAGRYRAQLLVQAPTRAQLHAFLSAWVEPLAALKSARRARWSLEVDPGDTY